MESGAGFSEGGAKRGRSKTPLDLRFWYQRERLLVVDAGDERVEGKIRKSLKERVGLEWSRTEEQWADTRRVSI